MLFPKLAALALLAALGLGFLLPAPPAQAPQDARIAEEMREGSSRGLTL